MHHRGRIDRACSLTDAALGGRTFPDEVTVHPAGRPGYVVAVVEALVASVDATHGYVSGFTYVDDDRCVPSKGIGALFEDDVIAGATAATGDAPFPLELIFPSD